MRTAVLISGRGSNLEAILRAEKVNRLGSADVCIIISNNPDALGLKIAEDFGKKTAIVTKNEGENEIIKLLGEEKIEIVVLAGFMQILTQKFIDEYPNRIINIHPSLLPSFPGLRAQKQAFNAGVKITGCTAHFVNEEVDGGPIILQKAVEVSENDTEEELTAKILKEEHLLLPKAISLLSSGKLEVIGRKVRIVD